MKTTRTSPRAQCCNWTTGISVSTHLARPRNANVTSSTQQPTHEEVQQTKAKQSPHIVKWNWKQEKKSFVHATWILQKHISDMLQQHEMQHSPFWQTEKKKKAILSFV